MTRVTCGISAFKVRSKAGPGQDRLGHQNNRIHGKAARRDDKSARDIIQNRFDKRSKVYRMPVSKLREAAVLQVVTGGIKACAPELDHTSV